MEEKNIINEENKKEENTNMEQTENKEQEKMSNEELAFEVMDGKWGEGEEIKKNLEEAGYNYKKVMKLVNAKLGKEEKFSGPEYYIVKHGDTLDKIAKEHKTTVKDLMELNSLSDKDSIFATNQIRVK